MHSIVNLLAFAAAFTSSVSAHGFMYGPGSLSSGQEGTVRDIGKINYQIDSLRNPNSAGFCRGAGKGAVTPISLSSGEDFTITLALSNGAQHIGDCWVEIVDANDSSNKVQIAGPVQCALPPVAQSNTDKGSGADQQCGGRLPKNLVTNDMCLNTWTFKPQNVDQIKCKDCILRWIWHATHISTSNPEVYENCADVTVSTNGSGNSGNNGNNGDKGEEEGSGSEPTSTIIKAVPIVPTSKPSTPSAPSNPTGSRHYRVIKKIIRHKKTSSSSGGSTQVKVDPIDTKPTTPSPPATNTNNNSGKSDSSSRCSERQMFCGSEKDIFHQCLADGTTYPFKCATGTVCKETAASIVCDYA
ncbi:hypothetical protein HK097_005983 [Rhizophlyctis rosea]|uniref:Chitin-binding type-4 domain-containing protein n=1 Tax=Rhizophlyctis rosea TaxID=64517 RepID=A0AAD5SGB1_9FUNG|nr:hypothetical protein HK097_005983 [Rhizophlyctis rosea]